MVTTSIISTITNGLPSTSTISLSSAPTSQNGKTKVYTAPATLSTGAKAGIGVGIGVGAVLILTLLVIFYRRRRRRKDVQQTHGGEGSRFEKEGDASQGADAKSHQVPTWKSELSGDSNRAELDATNERKLPEIETAEKPAELDAAGLGESETREIATEKLPSTPPKVASPQGEEAPANLSEPPPIPYASKPRPE